MAFIPIVAWLNYWRGIGIGGKHTHTHASEHTTTQEQVMVHKTAALALPHSRTHTHQHTSGTRAAMHQLSTNSAENPVKKVGSNSQERTRSLAIQLNLYYLNLS